jgi:hypothetical protein
MTAINATEPMPMPDSLEWFVQAGLYLSGADSETCNAAQRWFDERLDRPLTAIKPETMPMSVNKLMELVQITAAEADARSRCRCSECREARSRRS